MDNLESSFTIEINGVPIAKVSDDTELPVQATTGGDAAVFTLKGGRLQCGSHVLGRSLTENRSMAPKKVLWFGSDSNDHRIHPVSAEQDGSSYKLVFAGINPAIPGAPLIEKEGAVFADLLKNTEANVHVKMQ